MNHKFLISLAVGIITASSVIGVGVASERPLPAPRLDILGMTDPAIAPGDQGPLPAPKSCKETDHKCIKDFVSACESGGGYGTYEGSGNVGMFCTHRG